MYSAHYTKFQKKPCLTIGSYVSVRSLRYEACKKF